MSTAREIFTAWVSGRTWAKLFIQRTGTIAIIAYVFAEHTGRLFGAGPAAVKPLATAAIVALTAANIAGLRFGKDIQNVFTFLKTLAILLIIGAGFLFHKGSWGNFSPFFPAWSPRLVLRRAWP